jgi:hypothetical protein
VFPLCPPLHCHKICRTALYNWSKQNSVTLLWKYSWGVTTWLQSRYTDFLYTYVRLQDLVPFWDKCYNVNSDHMEVRSVPCAAPVSCTHQGGIKFSASECFFHFFFLNSFVPDNFTIIHCFYSRRTLAATFNFRVVGLTHIFLRLLALPVFHLLLWIFYSGMEDYQRTFITRNGLIFNCLAGAYFVSIIVTVCTCKSSPTVQCT